MDLSYSLKREVEKLGELLEGVCQSIENAYEAMETDSENVPGALVRLGLYIKDLNPDEEVREAYSSLFEEEAPIIENIVFIIDDFNLNPEKSYETAKQYRKSINNTLKNLR